MKLEDYSKYYIQGSDHYLIPKDEFVELFNEMINWKQESRKLNEQLKLYVGGLKREHEATQRAYDLEVENKKLKSTLEMYDNGVYFSSENDKLKEENEQLKEQLQQENKQLKIQISAREEVCNRLESNWNKLREIIRKKQDYYRHFKDNRYRKFLSELLDIMQELERSDNNDTNR